MVQDKWSRDPNDQKFVVFYSWQSDSPNATNRGFIEKALEMAIKTLNRTVAVARAQRPGEVNTFELDQDTQNVPGIPDIAETIYQKISDCDAFVADSSFVGKTFPPAVSETDGEESKPRKNEKLMPNSNVMVELGYAVAKCGKLRVILVHDTASGAPDELPFDLQHTRHPITYNSEVADRPKEREKLAKELAKALEAIFKLGQHQRAGNSVNESGSQWLEERLASIEQDTGVFPLGSTLWLSIHVIPEREHSLNLSTLDIDWDRFLLPIGSSSPQIRPNSQGLIGFVPSEGLPSGHAESYVQVFHSGRVEAVATGKRLSMHGGLLTFAGFEHGLLSKVEHYLRLMRELKIDPPFFIQVTLHGFVNRQFEIPNMYYIDEKKDRRILENNLRLPRVSVLDWKELQSAGNLLKPAFDGLWQAAGFRSSPNYDESGEWTQHNRKEWFV
jgi:hypothetical protein